MGHTPVMDRLRRLGPVGIVTPQEAIRLKHHALLFRCLAFPEWKFGVHQVERLHGDQLANEVHWLRDRGVLVDVTLAEMQISLADKRPDGPTYGHKIGNAFDEVGRAKERIEIDPTQEPDLRESLATLENKRDALLARHVGTVFRAHGIRATAVIGTWNDTAEESRLETVTRVIVDNIPVPDEATPWEAILEFREDDRVQEHASALRAWILMAARQEMDATDVAGEIDAAVSRYDRYMRRYKLGRTLTRVESLIQAAAIGGVAGIGIDQTAAIVGAVGSIAVTLARRKVELLNEEATAPGAELAYIVKARQRFGG